MIISIMSTIGALANRLGIVKTNLQLWLGFTKADVLGAELVVDRDFLLTGTQAASTTGTYWTTGSVWSINNGVALYDASSNYQVLSTNLVLTSGVEYDISFEVMSGVGRFSLRNGSGYSFNDLTIATYGEGKYRFRKTATASSTFEIFSYNTSGGLAFSITNISVKEVSQFASDKSTNTNNAKLFTGKALSFNGNDAVVLDGFTSSGTKATVAFWLNSTAATGYVLDLNSSIRFVVGFNNNLLKFYDGNGWKSFGSVTLYQYSRCVVILDGTTAKCFVNGNQLGSDVAIQNISLGTNSGASIGSNFDRDGSYFNGSLSDFQIYNAAWDEDDVAYDYANPNHLVIDNVGNTTITKNNLVGYWALSEGSGSIAYDSSGEGNNGTINGATYDDKQPTIPQLGMMDWSKGSNLIPYSNTPSEWSGDFTITENYATSPDGSLNAFRGVSTASSSLAYMGGLGSAGTNTISIYAKSNTGSDQKFRFFGNGNTTFSSDKIATSVWQRFEYSATFSAVTWGLTGASISGTNDIQYYGLQHEISSTVGSYIGTNGLAASNATLIQNPNDLGKDVLGNSLRLREGGFNLDGIGYGSIANDTTLQFGTTAFTIQAWIKPSSLTANNRVITKGVTGNGEWMLSIGTNCIRVYAKDSSGNALDTSSTFSVLTLDVWQMITVVIDTPNNQILFYLNDGSVETKTGGAWTGSFNNTLPITIGNTSSVSSGQFFDGIVDESLIYNSELSAKEIKNNYKIGLSKHS